MAQWTYMLFAILYIAHAVSADDEATAYKDGVFSKCKKEVNVPEDAAKEFYDLKSVEGLKDHKCFIRCINMEYKVLKEDGTMDEGIIAEAIKREYEKSEDQEKGMVVAKDCLAKVDRGTDLCEYSFDILSCYIEGIGKVGVSG